MSNGSGKKSAVSRKATGTAAVNLLEASGTRDGFIIYNESAAIMYLKFGPNASATDYTTQLVATTGEYRSDGSLSYTGVVSAVLAAGTGNAQVTDLS